MGVRAAHARELRGTIIMMSGHRANPARVLRLIAALIFCAVACTALAPQARAQPAAPQMPCDPQFMDALEAKAWMEAQREIAQNQNLIFKPDSVLEMTCFDQMVGIMASTGISVLFSEAGCCGGPPDPFALNSSLGSIVQSTLLGYLNSNFNFVVPYLNGRGPGRPNPNAPPNISLGNGYGCSQMMQIWNSARCMHFFNKAADDNFFDFFRYQGWDPRELPAPQGAPPRCIAATQFTQTPNVAFNGRPQNYILNPENPGYTDVAPYQEDLVVTHLRRIMPEGWGTPPIICNQTQPIPTGVCVDRVGIAPYADAVCPNPGCRYERPSGGGAGGSCASTPNPPVGRCVQ